LSLDFDSVEFLGKVSKSASTEKTEKVEQTKDIKNNQVKENVTTSDNHDKKDTKDNDSKVIEKSTEVVKEKVEKPVDVTKVEKVVFAFDTSLCFALSVDLSFFVMS
jgi:hypothetical protein